jgi:DMSO reductase anchor subunit
MHVVSYQHWMLIKHLHLLYSHFPSCCVLEYECEHKRHGLFTMWYSIILCAVCTALFFQSLLYSRHKWSFLICSLIPIFVVFSAGDTVQLYTIDAVNQFLVHRQNPNDCTPKMTYFTSLNFMNYTLVMGMCLCCPLCQRYSHVLRLVCRWERDCGPYNDTCRRPPAR